MTKAAQIRQPLSSAFSVCLAALFVWVPIDEVSGQSWGQRRYFEMPERDIFPGDTFTFCRIRYTSMGGRSNWAIDFPEADQHFTQRLEELTTIPVNKDEYGNYKHVVMDLTDPELFKYPFIYMVEVGLLRFSELEIERLREYLFRGGFLMVDDFWGEREWANWEFEISRVFDPDEYPMRKVPLDHPIFNIVFTLTEYPQVPSLHFWIRTGGQTSERGFESRDPGYYGIWDKQGRLMVLVCHNTDLGDGWEREAEDFGYFEEISTKWAYPLGINIVVYSMTH